MLYKVQKQDIKQAAKVLADAFQNDPLWNKLFKGDPDIEKRFLAFFEVPLRYCLKYGEVYAVSENLEGIAGWVPGKYIDMNMWGMIRSGALGAGMRMGFAVAKKMAVAFRPIVEDRRKHMAGRDFLYLYVVGVATGLHGRGYGRKLIDAAVEKAGSEGLPLYLETETEENVRMYEYFGFRLLKKVTLPLLGLPMWEMVKDPQA